MANGPVSGDGKPGLAGSLTALLVGLTEEPLGVEESVFEEAGVEVLRATGLGAAETVFSERQPDLVFVPVSVDGQSSRGLIASVLATRPQPVVVVIASNDQINAAAEAMRAGAQDCLFRPFSPQRLARAIEAAIAALPSARRPSAPRQGAPMPRQERSANPRPRPLDQGRDRAAPEPEQLIHTSPEMRAVIEQIGALAPLDAPVFLEGEAGTGKAFLARRLHELSPRAKGAFVAVDLTTVPRGRIVETLSGPRGALARAEGGTLYLDEICALDPAAQLALQQVLEVRGSAQDPAGAGARLVASTRHDARAMIRAGRLRAELFYRLHVAPISVPPLRARRGDIAAIAKAKLAEFSRSEGRSFVGFQDSALARLEAHDWPGNVRELANIVWSIVVLHDGTLVTPDMLPVQFGQINRIETGRVDVSGLVGLTLDEIERAVVEATLQSAGGSVPMAARMLDVAPSTIYRKRDAWAKRAKGSP